jgi:hypothetical protein
MDEEAIKEKLRKKKEEEELEEQKKKQIIAEKRKATEYIRADILKKLNEWEQVIPTSFKGCSDDYVLFKNSWPSLNEEVKCYLCVGSPRCTDVLGHPLPRLHINSNYYNIHTKEIKRVYSEPINEFLNGLATNKEVLLNLQKRLPEFMEHVSIKVNAPSQQEAKKKGWWQFWK